MIVVIGCGNTNRRDDGVGPEVIRALKAHELERDGVKLFDAGTDGMAVMFNARGCTKLIIVDAAQSGAEPGAIYEVPGAELERAYAPSLNLHDFRWDAALHAGRQIFREAFPRDVTVFLIQAQDLSLGLGLTPIVSAAAKRVTERIAEMIGENTAGEELSLKRGGLYLSHELCARHFGGLESVILLRRGDDLVIAPVKHAAAGGYLLKQRNGAGDRVVHAPDFFRTHGVGDEPRTLAGAWNDEHAAFIALGVFESKLILHTAIEIDSGA